MRYIARILLGVAGLASGVVAGVYALPAIRSLGIDLTSGQAVGVVIAIGMVAGFLVAAVAPHLWALAMNGSRAIVARLSRVPMADIVTGAAGLIVGLVIAALLGSTLRLIPFVGRFLPLITSVALGYIGFAVGVHKREEMASFLSFIPRKSRDRRSSAVAQPKVLDTSVIIDGRIADICSTGFIEGGLVVPRFVLEELRHIADSADVLKRNRGRRGLDILNRIQEERGVTVQIVDRNVDDAPEVDSKLIMLAKLMEGKIVTNDFNLNKVAQLEGVPVLNINELANAVKPVVLPGEEMVVHIIKDGKEAGQGVGYLDDGTMIVVDGGKRHVGATVGVAVTSVLQTAAGRMIFARLRSGERAMTGHGGR